MKLYKISLAVVLTFSLLLGSVAPVFAATTPTKAALKPTPKKTVTPKAPAVPKKIAPPTKKPVLKTTPIAPAKPVVPVIPATPPVVPPQQNPSAPNTTIIDMINTLPKLGGERVDPVQAEITRNLKIVDPVTDVAYMADGSHVYRYYNKPRSIYNDGGELKLRPQNWHLFNESPKSQLKPQDESGYSFSIPVTRQTDVRVRSGSYQKGETVLPIQTARFEQKEEESTTVTRYRDSYPGIDTIFRDSEFTREREIVIKELPQNLLPSETLLFWEEYDLPANAEVFAADGQRITGTQHQGMQAVEVKTPQGATVSISGATMFDGSVNKNDGFDLSPAVRGLSQIVTVRNSVLRIGLEVPASYLLDKNRVYPVTIDPVYSVCLEVPVDGLNYMDCSIKDFYVRTQDGAPDFNNNFPPSVDNNDIFVGLSRSVNRNYTRHAILYFNLGRVLNNNYLALSEIEGTVRTATLVMYYRNFGDGAARYIDLRARRIGSNAVWDHFRANYTGAYTYDTFRNNLITENPAKQIDSSVTQREHTFDVTASVTAWKGGQSNNGLLLEQDPPWAQAGIPGAGVDTRLLRYDGSEAAAQTSPYLQVTIDPPLRADLTYSNVVVPNSIRQGEHLRVTYTVTNNGTAASAATTVKNYFSLAAYQNPEVASINIPALNAGASTQVSVDYVIPANLAAGNYHFSFWIDRDAVVPESVEGNNQYDKTVVVMDALRSDLLAESVSFSDNDQLNDGINVLPGEQITISLDVANRGNTITNSEGKIYYSVSQAASYNAGGKLAFENTFAQLASNTSIRKTINYTIPQGTPAGTYYLSYFIDGAGQVIESNEGNNQGSIQYVVEAGRDIVPYNFVINNPRSMLSGEQIEVGGFISNNGNLASIGVPYQLALWSNDLAAPITLINQAPAVLPAMNPGQSIGLSLRGVIPSNIPMSGRYTVRIVVDPNDLFNELNNADNTVSTATNILVELSGYCGGCLGNGANTPPIEASLLAYGDPDFDGHPYLVEAYHGTPYNGGQISSIGDPHVTQTAPTLIDRNGNYYRGDPVNIRTGGFELTQNDFTLAGRGLPIDITRVYNSRLYDNNNRLGHGWNLSTASYAYEDLVTHTVTLYLGESLVTAFTSPDRTVYTAPDGADSTLTRTNETFTYSTQDGYRYIFARPLTTNLQLLTQVIDPNNNTNSFEYIFRRDIPLLSSVSDPSGRRLQLVYGAENDLNLWDKVIEINSNLDANTPTIVRYQYKDNLGLQLERVIQLRYYQNIPEELISTFRYDNSNRMTQFEDARGTILYNEYDGQGRVVVQRELDPQNPRLDANGNPPKIFEFEYSGTDNDVPGSATCTNVKNYRTTLAFYSEKTCFNSEGLRLSVKDGEGNMIRYTYDNNGMMLSATDARGAVTQYRYDDKRRVILEILPDTEAWHTEVSYEYYDAFNRLRRKTETTRSLQNPNEAPLTRVTNYVIDANGNVTAITDAENATQRFVYGQFGNVRSTIDKNGNETTYTYDPTGHYVETESITVQKADGANQTVTKRYGYDAYGNKISVTTGRNNHYTYEYDTHHNIRLATDPLLRQTRYEYDLEDHRIREIAPLNRITEYVYGRDIAEKMTSVRRLGENNATITTAKQYDFVGNLIADVDARANATRYTYNGANRVESIITPVNTIRFTYFPNGLKQSERDEANRHSEFDYDARGNLTSETRFKANTQVVTTFEYDGFNRQIAVVDANGNRTRTGYDRMDRPTQKIDAQNAISRIEYDAFGLKRGEINARAVNDESLRNNQGHSVSYFYDGLHRLVKTRNAQNLDTLYFYDEDGNLTRTVDRQNQNGDNSDHSTRIEYDVVGRKISETDALNGSRIFAYDNGDRLESRTDEEGRRTTFAYDLFDRMVRETDAANNATQYSYDDNGNRTAIVYADQTRVGYEYDAANRLRFVTDADGNRREYRYDRAHNKTADIDKNNRTTAFNYDELGRLVSETNPAGTTTTYTYDAVGNRLVTDTIGSAIEFRYDSLNRVERIVHPGNKTERFTYDVIGNVVTRTDGNNQVTTLSYDSLNRVTQKNLPGDERVAYTYDNWDNLRTVTDPASNETYEYDSLNRVRSESHTIADLPNKTFTVGKTYWRDGQLKNSTDANARTVSYTYNNRGLLESVDYNNQSLVNYAYTTFNKPQTARFQNGITTTYTYDNRHRLDTLSTRAQAGQLLFSHDYDYDRENNRTQLAEQTDLAGNTSNRTVSYTYDPLEQLTNVDYSDVTGAADIHFEYDRTGNRQSMSTAMQAVQYAYAPDSLELQSYTTNGRNQVAMTYDGNGNVTQENYLRLGRQTKSVAFTWDSRQRLKSLSVTDQTRPAFLPQLGVNTLEFAYDDAGNRIKKSVSGGESTYYINSGLTVLNELDARGEVSKTIVQGLSQIAEIDAQGRISFIHSDALDSAVFVSDEAGAVVQQYDYDPFGTVIGAFGSANTRGTKYQFTGQEFDGESNLSYFNARYLSSTTGRFIARDTYLGTDGNLLSRNRYTYVQNNPLKYVDPTGNEKKAKQVEDNGSTEVVHAAMAEQPQMHFAGWKEDVYEWTSEKVNAIGSNVAGGVSWLGEKAYDAGNATIQFTSDAATGAAYSLVDNYTYGVGTNNVTPPNSVGGRIGQSFGNGITYLGAGAEIGGGYILGTGGAIGTTAGLATCPVTVGVGCAAAGVSAAGAAVGAAGVAHGGSVLTYALSKGKGGGKNLIDTPLTAPEKFRNVRGTKAKQNIETGEIFEKDMLHKNHYEVYKNKKAYDNNRRSMDVWLNGELKTIK